MGRCGQPLVTLRSVVFVHLDRSIAPSKKVYRTAEGFPTAVGCIKMLLRSNLLQDIGLHCLGLGRWWERSVGLLDDAVGRQLIVTSKQDTQLSAPLLWADVLSR